MVMIGSMEKKKYNVPFISFFISFSFFFYRKIMDFPKVYSAFYSNFIFLNIK